MYIHIFTARKWWPLAHPGTTGDAGVMDVSSGNRGGPLLAIWSFPNKAGPYFEFEPEDTESVSRRGTAIGLLNYVWQLYV